MPRKKQHILKKKSKIVSTCNYLVKYTNMVEEIKKEFLHVHLTGDGVDGRDLKSMAYIFLVENPQISDDEFKEKTRQMYQTFLIDIKKDDISEEEREALKKPYLDMMFNFQSNYKVMINQANRLKNYLPLIVYAFLTQAFGTKREENSLYIDLRINSIEKVRENDDLERKTTDFLYDLLDDIANAKVNYSSFVDVTLLGRPQNRHFGNDYDPTIDIMQAKLDAAALKALYKQDKTRDYIELDVVKEIYTYIEDIDNTIEDLSDYDKSCDLASTAEHLLLKVLGEYTNEKKLNTKLFDSDLHLYTDNIYIDGRPIADYVCDDVKNMNTFSENDEVDRHKVDKKKNLTFKSKAQVLLKAIESGDKHIDIVRMNSYNGCLGYQIQSIKLKYNQSEYEKTHHYKWWQRLFGWGVKNIQRTFDSVYNDNTKERRFASISKHFENRVMTEGKNISSVRMFNDLIVDETLRTDRVVGVQKDIEELKNDNNIVTSNKNLEDNLSKDKVQTK